MNLKPNHKTNVRPLVLGITLFLVASRSICAGPAEYLKKLVDGDLQFREATLEHTTTKGQLWYSYTASKGNVLARSSPS
jgi:hypothetical protein